jgi:hypothetical protein
MKIAQYGTTIAFNGSDHRFRWAERAYPNLIYYNKVETGGHFAAWEQPQLFSEEICAAFRSLR